MSQSRGRRAPAAAEAVPLLPVVSLGQAAVGGRSGTFPAATLDGRGLAGLADPRALIEELRQGYRCSVAPLQLVDRVRFMVTIEQPRQLRFAFEVRYAEPFGDAFLGGAVVTGHLVVSFADAPSVAGDQAAETAGLVIPLAPGSLVRPGAPRTTR